MLWWKEIAVLKIRLNDVERELEKEQGKAARLAGFMGRMQLFGISPTGRVPRREFAEALLDSLSALLKAEQVVLFKTDEATLDLLPIAGRGISPEALSRLRVRPGEGPLGKAVQDLKTLVQNTPGDTGQGPLISAPYLMIPLISQARCQGLVLIAKPQDGPFSPEAQGLAALLSAQAALTLEDHALYESREHLGDQIIAALTRTIEARDTYTHEHSSRTRALVRAVTKDLALPESLVREIEQGAFLHDLGKIGVDDAVLRKPGKLTPTEYAAMKKHPAIGHSILQPLAFLKQVAAIVLYHQEWYNGSGYPDGLAGEEIPLGARIVQIIDAWDAMTSDRPYRPAMSKAAAIAELRRQEGTQFDPKLSELFLRAIDRLEREGVPTTEARPAATVEK